MTDREFEEILALGYERSGTELKGPGPRTNTYHFAKITRAVLGMANRRNGGLVIIGVEEKNDVITPVGLNATDLATWNYDEVSTSLAAYADPSVSFDRQILDYKGSSYVILRVYEFEDIPVLCRQDYNKGDEVVLRKGACYVRSRHKPETSEIPSQEDMRNLLDLAIDKGVSKFITRAHRAGMFPIGTPMPDDKDQFEEQLGDLR
jgi:predicted HTH transcriptional regulator